jgi:hypothetical protein
MYVRSIGRSKQSQRSRNRHCNKPKTPKPDTRNRSCRSTGDCLICRHERRVPIQRHTYDHLLTKGSLATFNGSEFINQVAKVLLDHWRYRIT